MNKIIYFASLFLVLMLFPLGMKAQEYHEDDKEGLRKFLRQPSAEPGKLNMEHLGLAISDTLDWENSEEWVEKMVANKFCKWNPDQQPNRLTNLTLYNRYNRDQLTGTLDCTMFTELTYLQCYYQQLTQIIADKNSKITYLNYANNLLRFSTLPLFDATHTINYAYFPQKGFANAAIPVNQIVDLSSEYLIDGINTTYTWTDEKSVSLAANLIEPLGNGIFKADAALVGKIVVCHMSNARFERIDQTYTVTFTDAVLVPKYHEDDKEGLRKFLRQPSAEPGKLNIEMLGLAISDTLGWNASEAWVDKLNTLATTHGFFTWNSTQLPQRLIRLTLPSRPDLNNKFAGVLDCTLFTELYEVSCTDHLLTQIIASRDSKVRTLNCQNNLLRFSTLPLLDMTYVACTYFPQKALPMYTIPVEGIIDLSSEYQINGINTVYGWTGESGAPLTLSSLGNGIFKADAALGEGVIHCCMTNPIFPQLTVLYTTVLTAPVQIYHEEDKEGLRRFLRQTSFNPERLNFEALGLTISDTLSWEVSEAWVEKLNTVLPSGSKDFCSWSSDPQSKKLISLTIPSRIGRADMFGGILDCTLFSELNRLICSGNSLKQIITNENSNISTLYCQSNALQFSTLPILDIPYYHYHSQSGRNDTIPVGEIIDLSSEYLINGITTVYEWADAQNNNPVTLTSLGNGKFKADAALTGNIVTCKMTNRAFPNLTLPYTVILAPALPVLIYHEDDKEGLRRFLRQTTTDLGQLNLNSLGLAISDTLNWTVSEEWVEKINAIPSGSSKSLLGWSNDPQSKRLISLTIPPRTGANDEFAGILDCTFFTELNRLICSGNSLKQIIVNESSNITTLFCQNNSFRFSTLPILDIPYYHYHSQREIYFNGYIPVGQIIDLSSEYLINGTNTVYEWYDKDNNSPLTLTSAGNGKFKADAALFGKTIICKMTNPTFPNLTLSCTATITSALPGQTYHEDDKEGLRRFLRQTSAEPGKINLEVLGLALSDTLDWETSEAWIETINNLPPNYAGFVWNGEQPKRLTVWAFFPHPSSHSKLAGILDCTFFPELLELFCSGSHLTQIIISEDSEYGYLDCQDNLLRFSTLPLLNIYPQNFHYSPQKALPTDTIPVTQVIDLSSEYMIDGINTIYTWIDEEDNSPLGLTSLGNGMFKANATLGGKTIACQMTNQLFPDLVLSYAVTFEDVIPVYHEDDKEGLRRFLRQVSAEPGKLNLEVLGLVLSDTLNWKVSEEWVEKLNSMNSSQIRYGWDTQQPKRLSYCSLSSGPSYNNLAGILDCSLFADLRELACYGSQLTRIIVGEDTKIGYLDCRDNLLRFSTLPLLNTSQYHYHTQKALPTDTISVEQVIDLSSEYLIDGTNTIYEWVDKQNNPVTLTSAGNGMFKANAALSGKTITCRMTNQRLPDLTLEYTVTFEEVKPVAYHEDDKEGLRRFLRQASAEPGKLNFEAFGLAISDTLQWETSDEWIEKLNTVNSNGYEYISWNNQHPKRLNVLRVHYSTSLKNKLAGILDCSPFTELTRINCSGNLFTQVIVSNDSKVSYLNCPNNVLRFSTLPLLDKVYIYSPQRALPTDTIPVTQVINLSSEYLIDGINTVYTWYDEQNNPITLISVANGMFKADTSFEGKTVTCHMTNQRFPDLTLEYKIVFESSSPEPEVITLVSHLTLEESPEKDYYVASSGERFKIFAQTLLNPELVRIGLFKSNGGAWIEDITQSRSGYTYTCEISQTMPTNNYMIQAYTRNESGDIQVIERKAQSFTIDKLPFAFVRNALLKYTPAPETMQSHLVLNSSAKNLYCLYIDNPFKVVVNIPVVGDTRVGLFDLFGELVEDVTESVSGKLFTCRMSYDVFPGNYMLLPYRETAEGIQIVERAQGAAVMDRLPVRVDYEWSLRSANSHMEQIKETEISIYPNPVQNTLHIKADNTIERIEIYNLQGKVLKKVMQVSEISVTDLPTGTYVIKVYTNNTQISRMFMKN